VLDALDQLGWPATFFMLGSQVHRYPDIVQEVIRRGHGVGVHGYDHRYLIGRAPRDAARDLRRAAEEVTRVAGVQPYWWRPPYGVLSGPSILAGKRLGLRALLWSAWGRDWEAAATPGTIDRQAGAGRLDGGTLLLHDSDVTSASGSWRHTVAALPLIADRLAAAGILARPLPGRTV
jgi:peptidoglycan/xylan/chitin deacetylase (PgdA/CDA1 family)